jgi:hypothetical protein
MAFVKEIWWRVVRCQTQNGVRVGIDMMGEAQAPEGAVLAANLTEEEALERCGVLSAELGLPEFDNDEDVFLGYAE